VLQKLKENQQVRAQQGPQQGSQGTPTPPQGKNVNVKKVVVPNVAQIKKGDNQ
jgi:hypothetical protein